MIELIYDLRIDEWPNWDWCSWVCSKRLKKIQYAILHCGIPDDLPELRALESEAFTKLAAAILSE